MQAQGAQHRRSQGGARRAGRARERAGDRDPAARGGRARARERGSSAVARISSGTQTRRTELGEAIVASEARLDADLRTFDELREQVRVADELSQALRAEFEAAGSCASARRAESLEGVRAEVAHLDVARATAEADLTHLATSCVEAVQATLDEVAAEVEQLERDGLLASPQAGGRCARGGGSRGRRPAAVAEPTPIEAAAGAAPRRRTMTPDEMVADLRAKIERMGAVNMMAIDQFDDLESRHTFLTAQRKDLVDAIAATGEAIKKIDKTTKERFREAFAVINQNFEGTFTTLFGGGKAGLVLLDESDQLESGIDIIAQPPGKRLQSVQLLSGGEKALTAMALMFAIFKYRPSPFCLLDEIDAPLDDANIGRFVEMLQGMQDAHAVHPHHAQPQDDGDRQSALRRDDGGAGRVEADFGAAELTARDGRLTAPRGSAPVVVNETKSARYHRLKRRAGMSGSLAAHRARCSPCMLWLRPARAGRASTCCCCVVLHDLVTLPVAVLPQLHPRAPLRAVGRIRVGPGSGPR